MSREAFCKGGAGLNPKVWQGFGEINGGTGMEGDGMKRTEEPQDWG